MNWIYFKLNLIVVCLFASYTASAEDSGKTNLNGDEELLPVEQTVDSHGIKIVEEKESEKSARKFLHPTFIPNFGRTMAGNTGFQLGRGIIQAPFIGQPQDAQAASASNKVTLVLDNDKYKYSELANPLEESLKRLIRTPDTMDDIVGHFQELGGGMTQQLLQQVSQSAPALSKSFGQALTETLAQTNLLAQVAPSNLDLNPLAQTLNQSNLQSGWDLSQLGQSFMGATQNLFNPMKGSSSNAAENVGAAGPETETESEPKPTAPKNPFENILGSALLPQLPQFSRLPHLPQIPQFSLPPPLAMFGSLQSLNPLISSGSEISEVRVLPGQYSPYRIAPKQVELQTIAEMKLKAVLKDALSKKTIPILWFHLPNNQNLKKTEVDQEMEEKLKIFEQQVIAELKQLQELSKMANEIKSDQLRSGVQPTTSLTTKLNLFEIPIYDITLGDIEKTLKDEHVMMLMQTLVQKQNKGFNRHEQATTKYLDDLTGTPYKRQAKTAEETLKTMEKDDMLKMMTYAYRMAASNGHEMPWLKKMTTFEENEVTENSMTRHHTNPMNTNAHMNAERQWLEEKQQQMAMEEEKQRQMVEDRHQKMVQTQFHHLAQQQTPAPKQMMPPQMQQNVNFQREMMPPQIQQTLQMQNQLFGMPPQEQRPMMHQPMLTNMNMQQQMPIHMEQQQQQPIMQMPQRQWADTNVPDARSTVDQRQSAELKKSEQSIHLNTGKMNENMSDKNMHMDKMPKMGTAKAEMVENNEKARNKGGLFDSGNLNGRYTTAKQPAIINYHHNNVGSHYPPMYAPAGGYQALSNPSRPPLPSVAPPHHSHSQAGGYGSGYINPPTLPSPPQYKPSAGPYGGVACGSLFGGYRTVAGNEEIPAMLQQQQQHQQQHHQQQQP